MTREEAKEIFLNRGDIKVNGGVVYDANKWREACSVISEWLEQEPKTGHWIDKNKNSATCSCCNRNNILYGDFCKWCGAKMIEPQERKDRE